MGLERRKQVTLKGVYDFSVNGGAVGTFELVSVPAGFITQDAWYVVETALTSGGTPTVTLGDGTDPDGYFANFQSTMGVVGVYGADEDGKGALLFDDTADAGQARVYTVADTVDLAVGTAALTAGRLAVYVRGTVSG